jgi:hypothetical protein
MLAWGGDGAGIVLNGGKQKNKTISPSTVPLRVAWSKNVQEARESPQVLPKP